MKSKMKRYQQAGLVALYNPKNRQIRHAKTGDMLDLAANLDKAAFGSRLSAETLLTQNADSDLVIVNPLDLLEVNDEG